MAGLFEMPSARPGVNAETARKAVALLDGSDIQAIADVRRIFSAHPRALLVTAALLDLEKTDPALALVMAKEIAARSAGADGAGTNAASKAKKIIDELLERSREPGPA